MLHGSPATIATGTSCLSSARCSGVLIADGERLYDSRAYHDRLLLGLSGIMSEAELTNGCAVKGWLSAQAVRSNVEHPCRKFLPTICSRPIQRAAKNDVSSLNDGPVNVNSEPEPRMMPIKDLA